MATPVNHTLGPECRLAPVSRPRGENGMPPVEAQFFYQSAIPIDDPLSTTTTTSSSDPRAAKVPLRPFGCGDNNALEKAWMSLQSQDARLNHMNVMNGRNKTPESAKIGEEKRHLLVQSLSIEHWLQHGSKLQPKPLGTPADASLPSLENVCCHALATDVSDELDKTFCALERQVRPSLQIENVVHDIMEIIGHWRRPEMESGSYNGDDGGSTSATSMSPAVPREPTSTRNPGNTADMRDEVAHINKFPAGSVGRQESRARSGSQPISGSPNPARRYSGQDGITGKPFIRVGDGAESPQPSTPTTPTSEPPHHQKRLQGEQETTASERPGTDTLKEVQAKKVEKFGQDSTDVPVGVSRLHMVSLPVLQMKPIYWSPVNDVAVVTRATWFYKDTMMPVPSAVSNQLETGYRELQPWTETWSDEIKCAIDVGALAEEKLVHQLWPGDTARKKAKNEELSNQPEISSDPYCAARCSQGEAAAEGSIESVKSKLETKSDSPRKAFSSYSVIYKDSREAFMLKPSLIPSAYYGRKPLATITKGGTVGIPVVRGFDRARWEKIHLKKQASGGSSDKAENQHGSPSPQGNICLACKEDSGRGQVTDLVLVMHGIGQKFAERVESFHFTHAINRLRRAVSIEHGNPVVQQILRQGHNRLMVLPINWRAGLSFEDSSVFHGKDKKTGGFGLKDIEPDTIPVVRSIISDVMFDIPFYMSHHKSKMIDALVAEANRVYRLWCQNNPGFAENGRVHTIAHSLGTAMTLEVLSHQPTTVPRIDLSSKEPEKSFFEFNTSNLFLLGSPAGFFLLLEQGALMPRRGRKKPGADPADYMSSSITGEAGSFGCLAVDNVYNILAKEDPIAYLLTGAVDTNYAASLKKAHVPSTAVSWVKSVGEAFRQVLPGAGPAAPPDSMSVEEQRPPAARLPSQLELEVHDFTREEIAEKKAYLLNDNGQIDWYLRSGGGPLEIQYVNMLSAHSTYWTNTDFIRMLCIEIGREPGRANTLPAMRAVKASKRMI
ncbi:DDHD domain [Geosmithia morbida]|uniref:DDHD domain n=1 Tax=Geosmithia morbida TaxID=1094350 RepID=A0A9P4YSI1_9HYPO|nr:DDHD domain [Geosmithia morbida]KAF4120984.1 DDHD domain [Geosmithia morbida]